MCNDAGRCIEPERKQAISKLEKLPQNFRRFMKKIANVVGDFLYAGLQQQMHSAAKGEISLQKSYSSDMLDVKF